MGKCNSCAKLGGMVSRDQSVSGYHFAILLSPVVSFWDCIVRKMSIAGKPVVRKVKKKQVKGEMDRLKQAEKKKRRLEKALATSAAIRSELEKKKQKKIEEQQRLDEEGAAIAEAVALHVLLGEDSTDDSCQIVLQKEEGFEFNPWDCASGNLNIYMDKSGASFLPHHYCAGGDGEWSSFSYGSLGGMDVRGSYFGDERSWGAAAEFSAGLIAAQAVSSLQIGEDDAVDTFVLDGMLRR
ncbi:unnamed protein product [Linum tenue]|uniref:Uncharacterized protein n=1 Tax=Linum tenue TaxID=586396 RepID=A0AAV0QMY9_9ROSI|nr:unnamed protein product [Linum tenue]